MEKETLLKILELSEKENISEKEACRQITGKYRSVNYEKTKFGIEKWSPGQAPHCGKTRKYKVNDSYFSAINTFSSYYSGFIAADGNISKDYNKLTIALTRKDRDFLEKFLENLESDYKIYDGISKEQFEYSAIIITSDQIIKDLQDNFNIIPNKSLIYTPPIFENKEFEDCFVMGLIDGDGTIGYTKRTERDIDSFYISFAGTLESVSLVKNCFERILNKETSNLYQRDTSKNFYQYRISDKSAREVYMYFYEKYNYLPTLSRKWNKDNFEYCKNWKKKLPVSRRKGVRVFNLKGELVGVFSTLKEASEFTGLSQGRISNLCKLNDNRHMGGGYMCSRDNKEKMDPYEAMSSTNTKYKEQKALDNGETNIEDES